MMTDTPSPPRRCAFGSFVGLISTGAVVFGLLGSGSASARYLPDTSIAPDGVVDISIRGDVVIAPGALVTSVGGNEFITVAVRDDTLAVCAFTTSAALQSGFGSNGCYRETLAANEMVYQLLVGKSGYWIFIADSGNAKRFNLLRLTASGQQDTSYGALGRRSFELTCDGSDVGARCPEVLSGSAQRFVSALPVIAETGDSNLWLLATRKNNVGADEGVVLHLEQGQSIVARANLYDALPASWIPSMQQGVSSPMGIVAHGDGVLVEHRTNFGYALIRVGANGAIDHGFAATQPDGVIVAGDGALPFSFFQMPVVAADNTFFWGFTPDARGRTRYDRFGATLGGWSAPDRVTDTYVIAAPASFASASTALWISDGTRVGRWQDGQWDPTVFGGQGPFQPVPAQALFALTRNEAALAMVNTATSSEPARLTIAATLVSAQPVVAALVVQANALLGASEFEGGIDPTKSVRSAAQADGRTVWQKITIDPLSDAPAVATGTLAGLPAGSSGSLLVSDAGSAGARWAVRPLVVSVLQPAEFYADSIGASVPSRRINLDAIRADMPPFIPVTPFSNPTILNVDIAGDGSALALIRYAHGTISAYQYRLVLARWNSNSVVANEYVPQIQWLFDLGSNTAIVQRDVQGRLLLIEPSASRIRRLSAQGVLDVGFAQAGTLDLAAAGFTPSETLSVLSLVDGGIWVGSLLHLVHVAGNGQVQGLTKLPPQAPGLFHSRALAFDTLLAEADGSVLRVSVAPQNPALTSRTDRLLRYLPTGQLDTQFGLRGAETLVVNRPAFSPTILPLADRSLAAFSDNSIAVFRYDPSQPAPTGVTVPAVEFYNTTLNHYFMTADVPEIESIEAGVAGPGWSRTGLTFPAYIGLLEAPGDALDICRFYGSAVPLARSPNGRTGPNSHFYTFAGPECDSVYNNDHAWQYEGPTLALIPLLANNTCAAGQQPVFRAYNNGYEARGGVWIKNDANHRYSTSQTVISEMVSQGWADEGRTFCAPN